MSTITTKPNYTESYLRVTKQDSDELQPGTNILTPGAAAKIQLNKKYSYLLIEATRIYNEHMEQKIKNQEVTILCPEHQDINDYMIRTSWNQLNHDKVYNMYIMDIITSMRIYTIHDIRILQLILQWYIHTNNLHCINQYKHYQYQLIALLHKLHITVNIDNINYNLCRYIINKED